jgi:hypothetical protein
MSLKFSQVQIINARELLRYPQNLCDKKKFDLKSKKCKLEKVVRFYVYGEVEKS